MKLTAKQNELVATIARGYIVSPIIGAILQEGEDATPELIAGINHVVSETDLTVLIEAVKDGLAAHNADFKQLTKVNKFLAEPETQEVLRIVQEISQSVQPIVISIAQAIISNAAEAQSEEV